MGEVNQLRNALERSNPSNLYYNYSSATRASIKTYNQITREDEEREKNNEKQWQPIFHSKFSGGFTFQNEILPPYMMRLMMGFGQVKNGNADGLHILHGDLWSVFFCVSFVIAPECRDRMHNYLLLSDILYNKWREMPEGLWPEQLAQLLCYISQDLFFNYHHAGLGIEYERHQSHGARIKDALGLC